MFLVHCSLVRNSLNPSEFRASAGKLLDLKTARVFVVFGKDVFSFVPVLVEFFKMHLEIMLQDASMYSSVLLTSICINEQLTSQFTVHIYVL